MPSQERFRARPRGACLESRPVIEIASFELDSSRSYAKCVLVKSVFWSQCFSERGQHSRSEPGPTSAGFGKIAAAGTNGSYHLYTPPAYDVEPDRRFPVVYWLHGGGGYEVCRAATRC